VVIDMVFCPDRWFSPERYLRALLAFGDGALRSPDRGEKRTPTIRALFRFAGKTLPERDAGVFGARFECPAQCKKFPNARTRVKNPECEQGRGIISARSIKTSPTTPYQ
jgi:hypothetical protein